MLRSRSTLSGLQKTYDESYLTCSTAVYYEGQGDEDEAMRCWTTALDQIREQKLNKTFPTHDPRSETEKALIDSLRQLEIQCKERIDLLQALRLSRQETPLGSPSPPSGPVENPGDPSSQQDKGWIGGGTIPAITYSQLSRSIPQRPSLPQRASKGSAETQPRKHEPAPMESSRSLTPNSMMSPGPVPPPSSTRSRTTSPERHTMRTTLRTARPSNKGTRGSGRPAWGKAAEGSSKAATLAWTALVARNSSGEAVETSRSLPASRPSSSRPSLEQPRERWDSHSRRLVGLDSAATNNSTPNSQSLSLRAASNALNMKPSGRLPNHEFVADEAEGGYFDGEHIGRKAGRLSPNKVLESSSQRADVSPGKGRLVEPTTSLSRSTQDAYRTRKAKDPHVSNTPALKGAAPNIGDKQRQDRPRRRTAEDRSTAQPSPTLDSPNLDGTQLLAGTWKERQSSILKSLPSGVDEHAAKQILNEIVVQGDEVHWDDIAGLDVAKNALREAVVYPFLRPDLFRGLREPARGMLLFGPPGTGKTMLARAVATESQSTFFSISATSLTSKYLGESEKLVRALFTMAKILAPSIIFIDEIDSLLSQRSGAGEHEATRRIKTEFLIQWSDLQRAAAGRETTSKDEARGDANRVLVLAATNLPWAIDEAARRRFVRRQYIPLPEANTRTVQLNKLLSQQKHTMTTADIDRLVHLTDGFSGSDITALAKDAAMGPLRSLGDALLHMTTDDIRPIEVSDFLTSLGAIRPSINKEGLKAYEDWAKEFGERGG